ncbi:hypothetical protein H2201_009053 [Coniosporium apollinis]|uniref:Uncharacterized protein n=2 Tax=Coniosporium TaxID=2810619 RepID=A0ABQ9NIT0_9PEZI|nr:hypothetical protein H2199_008770 [Cladosporium sp. JES 115]KAJ9654067.1 hypothetical protein H2201_009053 [Coniosporium apollinis]
MSAKVSLGWPDVRETQEARGSREATETHKATETGDIRDTREWGVNRGDGSQGGISGPIHTAITQLASLRTGSSAHHISRKRGKYAKDSLTFSGVIKPSKTVFSLFSKPAVSEYAFSHYSNTRHSGAIATPTLQLAGPAARFDIMGM